MKKVLISIMLFCSLTLSISFAESVVVRIEKSLRWLICIYFILYFVFTDISIRPWDAPDPSKGYIGKFALSMRMAGPLQMYRPWEGGPHTGGTQGPSGLEMELKWPFVHCPWRMGEPEREGLALPGLPAWEGWR